MRALDLGDRFVLKVWISRETGIIGLELGMVLLLLELLEVARVVVLSVLKRRLAILRRNHLRTKRRSKCTSTIRAITFLTFLILPIMMNMMCMTRMFLLAKFL